MSWTPSDYTAAGGLLVAILGLLLTALAMVLQHLRTRHERTESYRAALYSAELSHVAEILSAISVLHLVAKQVLRAQPGDYRERLLEFDKALREAGARRDAGVATIRARALRVIEADLAAVLGTLFPRDWADGDENAPSVEAGLAAIEKAWRTLAEALRNERDADALGSQVRELTGVAGRERAEADRQARIRRLDLELSVMTRGPYVPEEEEGSSSPRQ